MLEPLAIRRRRIYLFRHGEVSYFDPAVRGLPIEQVPLDEEGRRQAAAQAAGLREVPIDRVVTSPLLRCVQTAEILLADRDPPRATNPALEEIRPGTILGIPLQRVQEAMVQAFAGHITRQTAFLDGETFGALLDRVLACFRELTAATDWRHLLVVAHGGVNRAILTHALGSGLAGFGRIEQDAACVNVIDVDQDGNLLVRLLNHTSYNSLKVGLELTTMERLYEEFRGLLQG